VDREVHRHPRAVAGADVELALVLEHGVGLGRVEVLGRVDVLCKPGGRVHGHDTHGKAAFTEHPRRYRAAAEDGEPHLVAVGPVLAVVLNLDAPRGVRGDHQAVAVAQLNSQPRGSAGEADNATLLRQGIARAGGEQPGALALEARAWEHERYLRPPDLGGLSELQAVVKGSGGIGHRRLHLVPQATLAVGG